MTLRRNSAEALNELAQSHGLDPGHGLSEKVIVSLRTRGQLKPKRVQIGFNASAQGLDVYDEGGIDVDEHVGLSDISSIKVKDFNSSDGTDHWVLAISRTSDREQLAFEFDHRDVRDKWGYGMRTLLNSGGVIPMGSARAEALGPGSRKGRPIKSIELERADYGTLAHLRVSIGDSVESLQVPENRNSADDCRRIVNDFIHDHQVLEAEQPSLYRYVRSLVERVQLERETQKIVGEINALHLEEVCSKQGVNLNNAIAMNEMRDGSRKRLTDLAGSLEDRLGRRGPGASIVTQILRRNIEKMKLINDVYQKAAQAGVAPGQTGHAGGEANT